MTALKGHEAFQARVTDQESPVCETSKVLVGKLVETGLKVWDGWSFHGRMPEEVDPDH